MSPTKNHHHYVSNGFLNQSFKSYQSYSGSYGGGRNRTPPLRNNSPIYNYQLTYPQLQSKDVLCVFCKHRFYIGRGFAGRDMKTTYIPLLLPCGHAACSNCESLKPTRACVLCPAFPVKEARKNLPCNLYVVGLLHTIQFAPLLHDDADDIQFHVPLSAITRQHFEQGSCSECGLIAHYDCKQCEVRYCKQCFKKMHKKALQSHKPVLLNKNAFDFAIIPFCSNCQSEGAEYYCNNCDIEGCSHCIIKFHKNHNTQLCVEKNKVWIREFTCAFENLRNTRIRIHQTQQSLTSKMICPEAMKQAQTVENQITRHFVHLHGVLQNLEQELRNKLREQRSNLQRDVEDFRSTLAAQEEKLASACALAARAESNCDRVNLQKLTQRLVELADTPCHIVQTEVYKEEIKMELDASIVDSIRQHVRLHVPEVPLFHLVKTDELPQDYELEPLPLANETMITESSFKLSSQRDASSPELSTQSRSSTPSLNGSITLEPSSLEKGTREIVKVTHLVDPREFYVQRTSTRRILEEIEADIAKYIEGNPPEPKEILMNSLYVAQNQAERRRKWCRARVIDAADGSPVTYKVLFIDYGYEGSGLTLDAIRCAQPHFNIQPGLAVRCSLAEMAPVEGNEWDDETMYRFREFVRNSSQLSIQVLQASEPVRTVELLSYNNNMKSELSLRDLLLDAKLAKAMSTAKIKRTNPLSTNSMFKAQLPMHQFTLVEISYIESPSSIFVKQKEQEKMYQYEMGHFQYDYTKLERDQDLAIKFPEYGSTVAVRKGEKWERGMITGIRDEGATIDVFFFDIGPTERMALSQARHLPNRFCRWQARVIKVALADVKPMDDKVQWPVEATNFLNQHIYKKSVTIVPVDKPHDIYHVCMYFSSEKININALLVSNSYAESTGHRSKHTNLNKDIINSQEKKCRKKTLKKAKAPKKPADSASPTPIQKNVRPAEDNDPYKVRVYINKIISPDVIYVSDCSNRDGYKKMTADMQKFYKSKKGRVRGPLNPDWIYCVYSRKDKQFCRAQMIETSKSDPTMVKMALVDLGEVEEIPFDEIQPLEPGFIDTPKYQFKVRLAGIAPCGGSKAWQSSSCQKLKDIIHDAGDFKYYITLIDDSGPDDPMPVQLFIKRNVVAGPTEPNRKETLSVARCLVEHGLALPIRGININDEQLKEFAFELKKKLKFDNSNYDSTRQISDCSKTIIEEEAIINDSDDNEDIQKANEVKREKFLDASIDTTPLSNITEWLEPAHIQETEFSANITFVDYDANVHFHPDTKEYKDTLQYISDTLFEHYDKRPLTKYDFSWKVGDLCIASFHADKKWYRGMVTEVKNRLTVSVLFVDYGNIEDCSVRSLKKRVILENVPIQCTTARIEGIKPVGGKWKESDLDIIHAAVVSKPCQIKILSRPPNSWKVAIWVKPSETFNFIALPWYLKNETTASHIECDDNSEYSRIMKGDFQQNCIPSKSVTKIEKLIVPVNGEDSSEYSSKEEDSDATNISNERSVITGSDENEDSFSNTVRENVQFPVDTALQINHCNLSTIVNYSQSKRNLNNFSIFDLTNNSFNEHIDEKIVSGNSIYLKTNGYNDFDTQSVRSEALLQDLKHGHFEASTPLNTSFQDINPENNFAPIDFFMYGVSVLEISITALLPDNTLTGYVTYTTNEELNRWIGEARALKEEIFELAEEQPEHDVFESGKNCIVRAEDGNWYRARYIKKLATEYGAFIQVELVDFGNRIYILNESSIRTPKDKWLEVPMMGIHFKLHNVQFVKTKKYKELRRDVMKIVSQKSKLTAVIKEYEPMLELELYWDDDCKESVFTQMYENNILKILNSSVD